MIEVEYLGFPHSKFEYRSYIFARDDNPTHHLHLYMTIEGLKKPTKVGKVWIGYTNVGLYSPLLHRYLAGVPPPYIKQRVENVLRDAQFEMQKSAYNPKFVSLMVDLAEAYVQLEKDLKAGIPMVRMLADRSISL